MSSATNLPGVSSFAASVGLGRHESVLLLVDELSERGAVGALEVGLKSRCARVEPVHLPSQLLDDFPEEVRGRIAEFDVIVLAASQSWYQAPSRRAAKYDYGKRIVECYGLTLEMLKGGALCADNDIIRGTTDAYVAQIRGSGEVSIRSERGTCVSARVRDVFGESGRYDTPGSGGNLPAGELSIGVVKGSASGTVVFDLSIDRLGRLEQAPLTLFVEAGKVVAVGGTLADAASTLFEEEPRLRTIAEIGIGTNPDAVLGRSVLEDEKKLGTVHIGLGNDTYFGGSVGGPHLDGVFSSAVVVVDGTPLGR